MDTDAQEQARGITIKSTAITLSFPESASSAEQSVFTRVDPLDHQEREQLYVGNIPYTCGQTALAERMQIDADCIVSFRPKRGFAFVDVHRQEAMRLVASPVLCEGRVLSIGYRGDGAIGRLVRFCREARLPAPSWIHPADGEPLVYTVALKTMDREVFFFRGPRPAPTIKQARIEAAAEALRQLEDPEGPALPISRFGSVPAPTRAASLVCAAAEVAAGSEAGGGGAATADSEELTVNLIDCPGHLDFNAEVSAALRTCDGAVVVVDAVEGVCPQTDTVLSQAIREGVYPVLFVNKVDRLQLELQMSPEDALQTVRQCVDSVNQSIQRIMDETQEQLRAQHLQQTQTQAGAQARGEGQDPTSAAASGSVPAPWWSGGKRPLTVSLHEGTVAVGSGYFRWGFTVDTLARMYGRLDGQDEADLRRRLQDRRKVGSLLRKLAFEPVYKLSAAIARGEAGVASALGKLERLGVRIRSQDVEACRGDTKDLSRLLLGSWMPVADAVITLAHGYLPAPHEAQQWRIPLLCRDSLIEAATPHTDEAAPIDTASATAEEDACGGVDTRGRAEDTDGALDALEAMKRCDDGDDAPLCFFVSKLVQEPGTKSRSLMAFGRVFSGCLRCDSRVQVWGVESDGSLRPRAAQVRGLVRMMGRKKVSVREARAGDVVAVVGLDQAIRGLGTLTQSRDTPPALAPLAFDVEPIVHAAILPGRASGTAALTEAIFGLVRTDPALRTYLDPRSGQRVLVCAGELHLDVCVTWLRDITKLDVTVADPIVPLRESLTDDTHRAADGVAAAGMAPRGPPLCFAKSANKHNSVTMSARALPAAVVRQLERFRGGGLGAVQSLLVDTCGWSKAEARRVWAVSPEPAVHGGGDGAVSSLDHPPSCLLVDRTVGVQYLGAIRDAVCRAFHEVVAEGAACGEPLRGVVFEVRDATAHADPNHRGPGQVIPAAKRAMLAAQLAASPVIEEPAFDVTVVTPSHMLGPTYESLGGRGAVIVADEVSAAGDRHTIQCILPVRRSFGFVGELRGATSGRAFPSTRFHGWIRVTDEADVAAIAAETRARKGVPAEIPRAERVADRVTMET